MKTLLLTTLVAATLGFAAGQAHAAYGGYGNSDDSSYGNGRGHRQSSDCYQKQYPSQCHKPRRTTDCYPVPSRYPQNCHKRRADEYEVIVISSSSRRKRSCESTYESTACHRPRPCYPAPLPTTYPRKRHCDSTTVWDYSRIDYGCSSSKREWPSKDKCHKQQWPSGGKCRKGSSSWEGNSDSRRY